MKKDIDEIFGENSDYILELLLKLMEKFYGSGNTNTNLALESMSNDNDILEEIIYEDISSSSKALSSQVVKPGNNDINNAKQNETKQ